MAEYIFAIHSGWSSYMIHKIIGRKRELEILDSIYNSNKAEFLSVYGRRRISKISIISLLIKLLYINVKAGQTSISLYQC